MPDFEGKQLIYLQPTAAKYPIGFVFSAASGATVNDGSIPYGTTISSAVVKGMFSNGSEMTDLVDAGSVGVGGGGTIVNCTLSYPATSGAGEYTLEVRLTLSSNASIPYDAQRVVAGDRTVS